MTKDSNAPAFIGLGALGGFSGAVLGHVLIVAAFKLTGDASVWFKGPHGPPFFSLLVATALFYAALAAALAPGGSRARAAAIAGGISALIIYLPMAVATRVFAWGEGPADPPTLKWFYLVLSVYAAASLAGTAAVGLSVRRRRAVFAALTGLAAAYLLNLLMRRFIPDAPPHGWLPTLGSLVDGTLTGLAVAAALAYFPEPKAVRELDGGTSMKHTVCAALLLAWAVPAHALGGFSLPAIQPLRLLAPVGLRPAEVKVPMLKTLDTFRLTRTVLPLGDKQYHLAIQTTRSEEWAISLLEVGVKNPHEFEAANLLSVLAKHPWKRAFGGRDYTVTFDEAGEALVFAADDSPLGVIRVPLRGLRLAVFDAAVLMPALGPDWRMVFQVDLFRGAGMRSFSFLKAQNGDVAFHRVGAEGVDRTRKVTRSVDGIQLALSIDDAGNLVVERLADAP
ncbi:MAG: hypothetical protein AUJ52_06945 [Elusimicrobia bacterium CG1_02_63_36]|nr:MAG: hypothetical protein AUJ52_06945 [Elusimicrobia bacterium CG1_02_63_36]